MPNSFVLVIVTITGSANPSTVLFSLVVSVVVVGMPYSEVSTVVISLVSTLIAAMEAL